MSHLSVTVAFMRRIPQNLSLNRPDVVSLNKTIVRSTTTTHHCSQGGVSPSYFRVSTISFPHFFPHSQELSVPWRVHLAFSLRSRLLVVIYEILSSWCLVLLVLVIIIISFPCCSLSNSRVSFLPPFLLPLPSSSSSSVIYLLYYSIFLSLISPLIHSLPNADPLALPLFLCRLLTVQ